MSDDRTDENPFSFKHFIKNKNETPSVDNSAEIASRKVASDEPNNSKGNELPFPEVSESVVLTKKRTKGTVRA